MNRIRIYISVYPLWYKIINLIAAPVICLVVGSINMPMAYADADLLPLIVTLSYTLFFLMASDIYSEYYALGGICKKTDPFGRIMNTSTKSQRFITIYYYMDSLRRFLWVMLICLVLNAVAGNICYGILFGFFTYAILELIIFINRHVDSSLLLLFLWFIGFAVIIGIIVIICFLKPDVLMSVVLIAIGALSDIAITYLMIKKGTKFMEESYHDF